MLLPLALLLIHPQISTTISLSAEKGSISLPAAIYGAPSMARAGYSSPADAVSPDAASPFASEPGAALPEAPVPVAAVAPAARMAFINPSKRMKVSVGELI